MIILGSARSRTCAGRVEGGPLTEGSIPNQAAPAHPFLASVAGVFGTRIAQLASNLVVTYLLARLLGPDGRGVYAVLILLPNTLFAIGQFGLPSAMVFHAGRGDRVSALARLTFILGVPTCIVLVGGTLLLLPALEGSVLRTAPDNLLRLALLAVPLRLMTTLAGSILYGLGWFRRYNTILTVQSVLAIVFVLALVGLTGGGVDGALAAYLLMLGIGSLAVFAVLGRAVSEAKGGGDVPVRGLIGYSLGLYPATVAQFLGYRADVFLLGWLQGSAVQIGLYSIGVSIGELVFNVPDAVSTVLFPRMAGATREEAGRLAPAAARTTMLVTAAAALVTVPAAWIAIALLLPDFLGGIPALIVILPGIVTLSLGKVLTSYLSGISELRAITIAAVAALVANLVANLLLIPPFGIVGAAASSLLSYTLNAALMVAAASKAAGVPAADFVVPRGEDFRRLLLLAHRVLGAMAARRVG